MKFFHTIVAAALAATVLGDCNPLKSSDCPANPALAKSFKEDFLSKSKYFEELRTKGLTYGSDGAEFSLKDRFDNPSIKSDFYIMFGKVEVVMKAASGQGIISSFYLQSDDLDEIDIELFGGKPNTFQSNYFSKGDTTSYTRGDYYTASESLTENFVTYTLDWSKDALTWAIDGKVVRTLSPDDPQGYPQSPMAIFAGIWAGGDASNPQGTIEWAGGSTSYGPTYSMYIKSLVVSDYSTGDEYSYSDQTGSWESIKSKGGEVNGRVQEAKKDFASLVGSAESVDSSSESTTQSTTESTVESTTESTTEASETPATETDISTTVVTITSCADHKCTEVPHTTGVTTVTKDNTVYTTYCPLTSETTPAKPAETSSETSETSETSSIPKPKPTTVDVITDNIITETPSPKPTTVASSAPPTSVTIPEPSVYQGSANLVQTGMLSIIISFLLALI